MAEEGVVGEDPMGPVAERGSCNGKPERDMVEEVRRLDGEMSRNEGRGSRRADTRLVGDD